MTTDDDGTSYCFEYGTHSALRFRRKGCEDGVADETVEYVRDRHGRVLTAIDPASGTRQYRYNAFAQYDYFTDAEGNTLVHSYDEVGRLLSIWSSAGTRTFQYDLLGTNEAPGLLVKTVSEDNHKQRFYYDTSDAWSSNARVSARRLSRRRATSTVTVERFISTIQKTCRSPTSTTATVGFRAWCTSERALCGPPTSWMHSVA